ncbi:unnamed protein product [Ectocarpus sp. 12 AP-2014]
MYISRSSKIMLRSPPLLEPLLSRQRTLWQPSSHHNNYFRCLALKIVPMYAAGRLKLSYRGHRHKKSGLRFLNLAKRANQHDNYVGVVERKLSTAAGPHKTLLNSLEIACCAQPVDPAGLEPG